MLEREIIIPVEPVAFIQLEGKPYRREVEVDGCREVVDCNITADRLSHESGYNISISQRVEEVADLLEPLFKKDGGYGAIDEKIKHGESLDFSEAFSLLTFVCAALNRPLRTVVERRMTEDLAPRETHLLQATAFLSAMTAKEAYVGLTPQEIAGFVAATVHLDTFVRISHNGDTVLAIGGMGGDKGYLINGVHTKFFSMSTLSALAMAVDLPVHKHHSYPNTSKVGGQSAIEEMGARSDFHTTHAMNAVYNHTNLLMSSCHDTRTLHTLSHRLRGETINHVIGPLAFPIAPGTPLAAMIGVNEKIHPEIIVEAMRYLTAFGFQKYVSGAVFCGTDTVNIPKNKINTRVASNMFLKKHVRIDEVAPPPFTTIVAFLKDGKNMGTYVLEPEDFYEEHDLQGINLSSLAVPNEEDKINAANAATIRGEDEIRACYLAMSVGLGLFVRTRLELPDSLDQENMCINRRYLRECTQRALGIIRSGAARRQRDSYVEATKAYAGR